MTITRMYYRPLRLRKYQLVQELTCETGIRIPNDVVSDGGFVKLSQLGELTLKAGYACDGPSGPTFDTKTFMRGAFVHDGLYGLTREGLLGPEYREEADQVLRRLCLEDGMSRIRAWWVYWGVRLGGGASVEPELRPLTLHAP